MKKNLKYVMVACATLMMGFTSCSDSEDPTPSKPVDGEKGSLTVSFTTADLTTKAIDPTQTTSESNVTSIDVFVFSGGALEAHQNMTATNVAGTWTGASPITNLNSGPKSVYIAVNVPTSLQTMMLSRASTSQSAMLNTAYNAADASLADITTANSFTMFGGGSATVTGGTTSAAPAVAVSRLAAKATVVYDNTLLTAPTVTVAGGTIALSSLTYDIDNGNSDFYLATSGGNAFTTTNPSPMGWSWSPIVGDNPSAAATAATNFKYMKENIQTTPDLTLGTNITFIRIQAVFTPASAVDGAGSPIAAPATGSTFWTLDHTAGSKIYFANTTDVATYLANPVLAANVVGGSTAVAKEYVNGLVEYGIFPQKTAGKYDIVRNNYYIVTISGINGLGTPGGHLNPPIVIPPTSKGDLTFSLTVTDWIPESSTENLI